VYFSSFEDVGGRNSCWFSRLLLNPPPECEYQESYKETAKQAKTAATFED